MEDDAELGLLADLKTHALDLHYLYKRIPVVGDIMLLDTLQTMHRGTQFEFTTGEHDAHLLWNIAVKGSPESCVSSWSPCEPPPLSAWCLQPLLWLCAYWFLDQENER